MITQIEKSIIAVARTGWPGHLQARDVQCSLDRQDDTHEIPTPFSAIRSVRIWRARFVLDVMIARAFVVLAHARCVTLIHPAD